MNASGYMNYYETDRLNELLIDKIIVLHELLNSLESIDEDRHMIQKKRTQEYYTELGTKVVEKEYETGNVSITLSTPQRKRRENKR